MAGAGWRTFTAGQVLPASQVQNYLQDQVVQVYASAAARSSALGTAVATGMVSYRSDGTVVEYYNGSAWVGLGTGSGDVTQTGVQTLTNKTLTSPVVNTPTISSPSFTGAAQETMYSAGAFAGYTFYAGTNGAVQYLNQAYATANGAVNLTWTSGTTLNSYMGNNQILTLTMVIANSGTAYYPTSVQIDGSTTGVTTFWQGGTAPTSGNTNSRDTYTFVIMKLASGNFNVFASQTKFA